MGPIAVMVVMPMIDQIEIEQVQIGGYGAGHADSDKPIPQSLW